jgi:prefoldin subunit 5
MAEQSDEFYEPHYTANLDDVVDVLRELKPTIESIDRNAERIEERIEKKLDEIESTIDGSTDRTEKEL